jgi:hypothetical protein
LASAPQPTDSTFSSSSILLLLHLAIRKKVHGQNAARVHIKKERKTFTAKAQRPTKGLTD